MLERFKVPEEIAVNVDYQDMHTVVTQIFKVLGSPLEDAVRCANTLLYACLLYTSPSPRDGLLSRMPSSA